MSKLTRIVERLAVAIEKGEMPMSWNRRQFRKERKQPRHARTSLCVVHCADCGRELRMTHLVIRFGERCRGCWQQFVGGPVEMASR